VPESVNGEAIDRIGVARQSVRVQGRYSFPSIACGSIFYHHFGWTITTAITTQASSDEYCKWPLNYAINNAIGLIPDACSMRLSFKLPLSELSGRGRAKADGAA
jgi:hypothetical protein